MERIDSFSVSLGLILILFSCNSPTIEERPPNFIIIFTDDQGYGDLSCFGAELVSTPNIDQMAREGARLTSFYVAASVCSPSRAALMTGSYPKRIDMCRGAILSGKDYFPVMLAGDRKGLNPSEITIAEILKSKGYATSIFGKWHLGDQPEFLPTRQGFDEFFGIPYSHDIHTFHPRQDHFNFPALPLLEGEEVIEMDPDADLFTRQFTERALSFIEKNRNNPFFIYLPHPIPHNPLHASLDFMSGVPDSISGRLANERKSFIDYQARNHLYPQAISEIDWSVGEILKYLRQNDLAENTLVIFTTDNGPGSKMASAGPLRGRKGTPFEGGLRVPAVVWWPGKIKADQEITTLLTSMDLFPTLAHLADSELPDDRVIDGKNIWPVLSGDQKISSHDRFFYYHIDALKAVRWGPWKLHRRLHGLQDSITALYNLETDLGERVDVSDQHPEVVDQLLSLMQKHEEELGKGAQLTAHSRPAGMVEQARPLQMANASHLNN